MTQDQKNKLIDLGITELPEYMMDEIIKKGVPTGSVYFGVQSENYDYDVILPPDMSFDYPLAIMNGARYLISYEGGDFSSCYILYGNEYYNLLFMHGKKEFDKWVYATNKMYELANSSEQAKDLIRNKTIRVELFEQYKDEYKQGSLKNGN